MTEYDVTIGKVHYGTQSPWVPGLEKLLQRLSGIHPEADFLDFIGFMPQMWATHSVEFDWGYLPIMTFTSISPDNGQVKTQTIFLFQIHETVLSKMALDQIADEFEELVYEEIDQTFKEMLRIGDGIILNRPFTSTFLALELINTIHFSNCH